MGDILIVEPYRMLRHAFSTALFPEHQVEFIEEIPEPERIKRADVVIVDAGALRERGALQARELRAVQSWSIPTVWIDTESSDAAPARENLFSVSGPVTKESLQRLLAECLKASDGAKKPAKVAPALVKAAMEEPPARSLGAGNVIELVDVVEEDAPRPNPRVPSKS